MIKIDEKMEENVRNGICAPLHASTNDVSVSVSDDDDNDDGSADEGCSVGAIGLLCLLYLFISSFIFC